MQHEEAKVRLKPDHAVCQEREAVHGERKMLGWSEFGLIFNKSEDCVDDGHEQGA